MAPIDKSVDAAREVLVGSDEEFEESAEAEEKKATTPRTEVADEDDDDSDAPLVKGPE